MACVTRPTGNKTPQWVELCLLLLYSTPDSHIKRLNPAHAVSGDRLVGDKVEVRLPVPGDIDPAQWQPLVDDLLQIQSAELLLLNGAGYSPWVATAPLAASRGYPRQDECTGFTICGCRTWG